MADLLAVRKRPCSSCPYRRDVPSGIWTAEEYAKLPAYDGPTWAQPAGLFHCHSAQEQICAGWAGCHDMTESLAARFHARDIDPAVFEYTSPVPLFASGAEAAEHGMRDLDQPGEGARRKIAGLLRQQAARRTDGN